MNRDVYFYGIDFKKIKLHCKINILGVIKTKRNYSQLNKDLNIDSDSYYEVVSINFLEEHLTIKVSYKQKIYNKKTYVYEIVSEDYMPIILNFDFVEFSYYFENTKEENLDVLEF